MKIRKRSLIFALVGLALCSIGTRLTGSYSAQGIKGKRGGRLVMSKAGAPRTFNRLYAVDEPTTSINNCMDGHLIRINRRTQQPEAELAQSWKVSPDGKRITFTLRPGLKFSDGRPASADDVLFTFQIVNDTKANAIVSDQFNFQGQRVRVEKIDAATVAFTFPTAQAAAVRLFDGVPILPRHVLQGPYQAGRIEQAWGTNTPPDQIVGLGPFRLRSYVPGQRVVLQRNDYYWKTSASGEKLPFLDELIFTIDPEVGTQLLKFQQGETDVLSPVSPEHVGALSGLAQQGKVQIHDLGASLIREVLWFNLNEGKAASGRSVVDPVKLAWFKDTRFRQAVSQAIDRQAIVNLAFAGRAAQQWAFVSAGDRAWFNPNVAKYPRDINRSLQLLKEAGFSYNAGSKVLTDAQGRAVGFALVTNTNAARQKIAALIQSDLARIGIKVSIVAMNSGALLGRINDSFDYEAGLLGILSGDCDPSSHLNVLFSGGNGHWWNPNQTRAATGWEARIDELMREQMTTINQAGRKRLFDEVQKIMAEQQAFIFLASRNLIVAAKTSIGNLKPAILSEFAIWNCEELFRN